MDRTGIEWTDATWNPVTGCTKVSPGCDHCYAETIAHRFAGTPAYPAGFEVTLRPERIDQPLRWTRPRRIFVNSMSDLFHDDISDGYIAAVWSVMARAPQHTFQILTKRHARMRNLLAGDLYDLVADDLTSDIYGNVTPIRWPLPNVWLGVSVETQQWADIRIPPLLQTPAAVRFLSCEPLLGPIDLDPWTTGGPPWHGIDWVIAGGESGPHARPMHPAWPRSLRYQCVEAGVPFLFKQWGEWAPTRVTDPLTRHAVHRFDDGRTMRRVGKKTAGRELDGTLWDQYPDAA
jgi:protein gp37